jgi:cell division protein FtsX
MSAAAIQLDLNRLSEEERAQYDALLDRLDIAFAKIVEYLAAKSGCNNAASLSREARERLLVEASRLTDAFDQVHTDENPPITMVKVTPDPPMKMTPTTTGSRAFLWGVVIRQQRSA